MRNILHIAVARMSGICLVYLFVLSLTSAIVSGAAGNAPARPEQTAAHKERLKERDALWKQAVEFRQAGKLREAVEAAQKMLAIEREVLGNEHEDVVGSLKLLMEIHEQREDFASARKLAEEILTIQTSRFGAAHWAVTNARRAVADLEQRRRLSREDRQRLADAGSASQNAAALYQQGKYTAAVDQLRQVIEIQRAILGEQHPDTATSLNNLAVSYDSMGEYAKAEPLHRQALEIRQRVLGPEHRDTATSLNNLAFLYASMGDYAKAEPLYRRSLEIRQKVLGPEHPDMAASLNNLAGLYKSMGDYAKAEPLLRQSLQIRQRVLGPQHPDTATSLNSLALLHYSMGDYAKAEPLYRQSLKIRHKVSGPQHPDTAQSLNNLAGLYGSMGDYAKAEPLCRQSLEIWQKVLGPQHPDTATSLSNLAHLYLSMGDYAKAEPLHRQSLDICQEVLGPQHPDTATSLNNLAGLYDSMGDYAKAEPLYRQSLEIWQKVLGPQHPSTAASLNNLALLYGSMGDYAKAEPLYRQALAIVRPFVETTSLVQSERQQLTMGEKNRFYLDNFVSLAVTAKQYENEAFREVLAWKGATLVRQRQVRQVAEDERIAPLFKQLQQTAARLATLARAVPDPKQHAAWRRQVLDLTAEKERLEADLSGQSAAFREVKRQVTLEDVVTALPKDAALVDFLTVWIRVPRGSNGTAGGEGSGGGKRDEGKGGSEGGLGDLRSADPAGSETHAERKVIRAEPKEARDERKETPAERKGVGTGGELKRARREWRQHLVAFVVRHERPVKLFDLGPVAPLSEAIDNWRGTFGASPQGAAAGRLLRERIWEPVEPSLEGAKTVLVSADGVLGRLPLGALPGKADGSYLIEDYRLAMLPVPQLLPALVNELGRKELAGGLLTVGDVDYDADRAQPVREKQPPRSWKRSNTAEVRGGAHFGRLEASAGEIATIQELFTNLFKPKPDQIKSLKQAEATETAFRESASRFYNLHLATHGFFADPSKRSALAADSTDRAQLQLERDRSQLIRGYNPGLLSGLALAGANRPSGADADDGILTAEEIASLTLQGVDLVVLSACETGLGKRAGGEGLIGIQRAFQVSGARTTVASLWEVADVATRRLMERFYRNYWEKEMSKLDALREAQLWLLNHPEDVRGLEREDGEAGGPQRLSPRHWAAFVLSGDWR